MRLIHAHTWNDNPDDMFHPIQTWISFDGHDLPVVFIIGDFPSI